MPSASPKGKGNNLLSPMARQFAAAAAASTATATATTTVTAAAEAAPDPLELPTTTQILLIKKSAAFTPSSEKMRKDAKDRGAPSKAKLRRVKARPAAKSRKSGGWPRKL